MVTYDENRLPRLFGAEAEGNEAENVLDQGGFQVRWWKLHLKPEHLRIIHAVDDASREIDLDPLPEGITAEQVCAGFLAYMVRCIGESLVAAWFEVKGLNFTLIIVRDLHLLEAVQWTRGAHYAGSEYVIHRHGAQRLGAGSAAAASAGVHCRSARHARPRRLDPLRDRGRGFHQLLRDEPCCDGRLARQAGTAPHRV